MNPPATGTPSPSERLRQASDSPWFWLWLFVNGALIGMLLIGPKYRQREAMLERRYEARREASRRPATAESAEAAADRPLVVGEPHASERALLVPLWPLGALLAAVDVAAALFWLRQRRVQRATATPPR